MQFLFKKKDIKKKKKAFFTEMENVNFKFMGKCKSSYIAKTISEEEDSHFSNLNLLQNYSNYNNMVLTYGQTYRPME